MVPPQLRVKGQSVISDQEMRDMTSKDPDSPLKAARAAQAARLSAERAATMPNAPRLDRVPREIHDNIASRLPPRSKIALADTNRALRAAYQPHVQWAGLLDQVEEPSLWESPQLFERSSGNPWQPHTDADIGQRLRAFLDVPAHAGDGPAPSTIRNMPVEDKASALISVLRNAFGREGPGLRQLALDLTRPHVEDLPAGPLKRVVLAMADMRTGSDSAAPDTRWCLDVLERKGPRGNGASIARLAGSVRLHFRDDQECMQSFSRFEALARRLDQEGDLDAHRVRCSLASIYQTMPNPLDAARLLLTNVASRPDRERTDVYWFLARGRAATIGIPAHEALTGEQRQELENMLEQEAASLPNQMREEISNVALS